MPDGVPFVGICLAPNAKRRVNSSWMTLQDWNPLSYFRELGTFPKTVFLIGFVFLGVGIARGLSPYNRTVILALAMIAFSLTIHYLSHWSYPVTINGRVSIKWKNLFWGVSLLAITAALGWWLWVLSGRPSRLPIDRGTGVSSIRNPVDVGYSPNLSRPIWRK